MARDGWLNRAWLPESRPISPAFSSWLDGLRWIAAALVCSAHVRSALLADYGAPAGHQPWAAAFYWGHGFGHQAVIVFFVLSGFLVGGEVLRGLRQASFDWRVYGIRRFSRLYPVYLAALLLGALWDNLGLHFFNDRLVYNSAASPFPMIFYPVVERLTPGVLEGNLLFLQGVLVPTFGSNSPLWSLANEAWYYFLFPLLLWPFFAAGRPGGRLACFVLFAAGAWLLRQQILGYFSLWLLGATLCCLPRRLPVPAWLPPLLLASLLTLVRLRLLDGWSVFQQDLVIAALLGLWLNQLEHQVAAAPGPAAWHRRLAGFSYSLYLVHWPLALLLSVVLDKFTGHGHRMAFSAGAVLLYGAVLAFIYAFAWLVAQGTERHTASIRGKCLPSPCAGLPLPLPPAA